MVKLEDIFVSVVYAGLRNTPSVLLVLYVLFRPPGLFFGGFASSKNDAYPTIYHEHQFNCFYGHGQLILSHYCRLDVLAFASLGCPATSP